MCVRSATLEVSFGQEQPLYYNCCRKLIGLFVVNNQQGVLEAFLTLETSLSIFVLLKLNY